MEFSRQEYWSGLPFPSPAGGYSFCSAGLLAVASCGALGPAGLSTSGLWHMGWVAPWHVGSSWARGRAPAPCISRWILSHWTTRQVLPIKKKVPQISAVALRTVKRSVLRTLGGSWWTLLLWLRVSGVLDSVVVAYSLVALLHMGSYFPNWDPAVSSALQGVLLTTRWRRFVFFFTLWVFSLLIQRMTHVSILIFASYQMGTQFS